MARVVTAQAWARAGRVLLVCMGSLLAGCSQSGEVDPIAWWHDLQGGEIAKQRPPPPGADDPYPNLATVPPKPPAADPKLRQQVADALVADRTSAQHAAAAAPLPDPSSPTASPQLFGGGAAPPAKPADAPAPASAAPATAATASLAAASAPPAPPSPPKAAPVAAVASTPLAAPAAPAAAPIEPPPPEDAASPPPLPAGPPPQASLPGIAAPPPPPPPTLVASNASGAASMVSVGFASGSAALDDDAAAALRSLASHRGQATIALTGFGDAASASADAQSSALTLGLARAQAMATMLAASGVPQASLRVDAEASGRGGQARLLN